MSYVLSEIFVETLEEVLLQLGITAQLTRFLDMLDDDTKQVLEEKLLLSVAQLSEDHFDYFGELLESKISKDPELKSKIMKKVLSIRGEDED